MMKRQLAVPLFLLSCCSVCQAATGYEPGNYVSDVEMPAEVKPFVGKGMLLLELETADLSGKERKDYILVLEKQKAKPDDPDIEEGQRPLVILQRDESGALKQVKRNDKIVLCATCGGMMGDPFQGVEAGTKTFTVSHYGGAAERWSNEYKFNYSRIDDTWQLVRAKESSFDATDPDTTKTRVYTPPKDYGKVDIADFAPDSYLSKDQSKAHTNKPTVSKSFVAQGGLTWMPVSFDKKWSDANAYCSKTAINGQKGWRMPTKEELIALYNSGAMKNHGWTLLYTWSSSPDGSGKHSIVVLNNGYVYSDSDNLNGYVTCVH